MYYLFIQSKETGYGSTCSQASVTPQYGVNDIVQSHVTDFIEQAATRMRAMTEEVAGPLFDQIKMMENKMSELEEQNVLITREKCQLEEENEKLKQELDVFTNRLSTTVSLLVKVEDENLDLKRQVANLKSIQEASDEQHALSRQSSSSSVSSELSADGIYYAPLPQFISSQCSRYCNGIPSVQIEDHVAIMSHKNRKNTRFCKVRLL